MRLNSVVSLSLSPPLLLSLSPYHSLGSFFLSLATISLSLSTERSMSYSVPFFICKTKGLYNNAIGFHFGSMLLSTM